MLKKLIGCTYDCSNFIHSLYLHFLELFEKLAAGAYIYIYIDGKPKHVKLHMALYKKVDLIEQNQCDFLIQYFNIVLDLLKKLRHQFFVDQGSTFYINGKPKHVKTSYSAI